MMLSRPRNIVMVCSVVVFCAAVMGCSSSDDGKTRELEGQLDMANQAGAEAQELIASLRLQIEELAQRADLTPDAVAALQSQIATLSGRADISLADLAALQSQVATLSARPDITAQDLEDLREQLGTLTSDLETAEQTLIDRDVRLGMADAIPDLRQAWGANVDGASWAAESATWFTGSPKHSAAFFSAVWFNDDQELEFFVDMGLLSSGEQRTVIQTDPVEASLSRFIDTSRAGDGHPNVMTTTQEIEGHGLGVGWQGMQATKTYDGGGHLKIDLYTDAEASDNPARANVRDEFQHDIAFEVIQPLPKDRDYQWFNLGSVALPGTLDGVPGHFTCADGHHPDCGFGTSPDNPERYDVATLNDVIFTPDDGSAPITLDAPGRRGGVPVADYLSLGAWQYVPEDVTDVAAYEVGMFVTAGDPFAAGGLTALSGTAQYAGKAVGLYANKRDVEDFSADVELTADFGSDADLGTLAGRVFNISLQSGAPSPLEEIGLSSEHWIDWIPGAQEHNIREGPPWNVGAVIAGGETVGWIEAEGWDGFWAGLFAGNGNTPTDHPNAFAGTFTATRDNEESFAGSFGTHRE